MLCAFKITEMVHELKTWNEYFEAVFMGHKTFEVRKNDRDFKKGDTLILKDGTTLEKPLLVEN